MLFPCVMFLLVLTIFPIVYSLRLSFFSWNLLEGAQQATYLGLENYASLVQDPVFWEVLGTTLKFSLITVALEALIGLGLALLLDASARGVKAVRILVMVPMVVAPIVIGTIWRQLLNVDRGHVNFFLSLLGITPQGWLSDPGLAFPAAVFVDIWKWCPLVGLMLLAGLQSIPPEIFEAGRVDGARGFATFIHLTLPMLMPYIAVAVSIRLIDSFKTFDYLWVMTSGGPGRVTELLSLYTFRTGLRHYQMGTASALSLILVVVSALSGIALNRILRRGQS